jgi:DHA3 family tetracycline resistance protein-like MFS transporter
LLIIVLGIFLAVLMPETGFHPTPRGERSTWAQLRDTFTAGWKTVRGRPTLLTILGIGLVYGLYSEGLDRLWTKHLLDNFAAPFGGALQPVVFIGVLRAVGTLLSVGAAGLARRHVATDRYPVVARALFGVTTLLVVGLFTFALAGPLALAVLAYWLIDVSRSVIGPLYTAWVNQRLDSQVRATVLSMSSQVDAIGQIAGGPAVGVIGSLVSVRAALFASATILSPVLLLFTRALRLNKEQPVVLEPVAEEE